MMVDKLLLFFTSEFLDTSRFLTPGSLTIGTVSKKRNIRISLSKTSLKVAFKKYRKRRLKMRVREFDIADPSFDPHSVVREVRKFLNRENNGQPT